MQDVTVYDANGNSITELVQWDSNVKIFIQNEKIDKAYKVHFYNAKSKEAIVVTSTYSSGKLSVTVPNDLTYQAYTIFGYVYVSKDGENRSMFGFRLPIRKRPKPSDLTN